ncbi:PQQ-binding-like beta-propeller repeat protein [Limnoglobus roseus]|uniref:Pyrrolo-quinoline quinone n=1 Tax=Limnoglobus roseus TaxID=2598579 RepID=A0A5C1A4S4_9BACT|nr:PQQ-binding-like beta-propeller repeat protein [Limnoglobus roseus]QEL13680.1 pyrrolo-quinoline quinone [Limnoglobus roseus]
MLVRTTTLALVLLTAAVGRADDWPNWMGPKHDNVWRETGLIEKFPEGGPKVLWRTPVGGGYAGPAVSKGKVYVTDYVSKDLTEEQRVGGNFERKGSTGTERVHCLDEATGKPVWKSPYEYPVKYAISYPAGPRCTPTVHDGKVYTLGAEGHLACLDAETGAKVWAKELKDEYKTKSALWGYASHPFIDGQKLITLAGGDGSHVVAFDKNTGKEIWRSQSQPEQDGQGYAPVTIIDAGGGRQLIVAGPKALRSLDPETGKRNWSRPYDATNGATIMTPVVSGEYLYFGGYNHKNLLLKLKKNPADEPEVVWQDKKNAGVSPVNVQPFLQDGVLYGYDDSGDMYGVELPSGKRLWKGMGPVGGEQAKGSETAFIVKTGDRFVFFAETGHLVFGKLTPQGYEEIDRAKVIEQTGGAFGRKVVWSMPAFANKHAYIRNDKEIICVDLAKP